MDDVMAWVNKSRQGEAQRKAEAAERQRKAAEERRRREEEEEDDEVRSWMHLVVGWRSEVGWVHAIRLHRIVPLLHATGTCSSTAELAGTFVLHVLSQYAARPHPF